MKKFKISFLAIASLMFYSCELETDLEVENLEEPTSVEIGNEATGDKLFQNWYNTKNNYYGPGLMLNTIADQITMSHGNQAMLDMSSEPRIGWNNSSTYSHANVTYDYFNALHAVLADANAIAKGLAEGAPFSDVDKYESLSKFGQGAAIGDLAMVFDRVYASDETGVLNDGEAIGYQEAIALALEKLDLAIAAAERGSFTLDSQVLGKSLSSEEWAQFLNTLAARYMVLGARNAQQRAALDWNKVLSYTQKGLTYDFAVGQDGWINWWPDQIVYSIYPGWGRVDMRIINFLDPNTPAYWPSDVTTLPASTSEDARLELDFEYLPANTFNPDRGTYHYSSYRHSRYDDYLASGYTTDLFEMLKAENDLYMAEAYLRLGDLVNAAATINASSRVVRGGLPPVAEDSDAIAEAIHYERMIELLNTGLGLGYYEMRGTDNLQKGTPLHFPIPGAALDAAGLASYTFGGTTGTAGEDYSAGGWR